MKTVRFLFLLIVCAALAASARPADTFSNPLRQGEDPWVIFKDGNYYVCNSGPENPTAVCVSKSPSLLDRGEVVKVWEDGDNYRRVFAPELHFIDGKWYIYFCADVRSENWRHMAVVLVAKTDNPLDGFTCKGVLFTGDEHGNGQANDFTVVTFNGQLYACWGSLSDKFVDGAVIAPMDNPTTITAYRKEIGLYAEGPRAIVRNGKLIMTGAAGGFASKSYRLIAQMYVPAAGPIDSKSSWKSLGVLLHTTSDVWGPSRASFTVSADGTENWVMFHSKIFPADDNGIREVNIQKFNFDSNDVPVFAAPAGPGVVQAIPSGDPGMGDIYPAEKAARSGGAAKSAEHKNFTGSGYVTGFTNAGAKVEFTVKVPAAGEYRATLRYANGVYVEGEQKSAPTIRPPGRGSLSLYVNGAHLKRTYFHRTTDWDVWMLQGETVSLKAGKNKIAYQMDAGDAGNVELDFVAVTKIPSPVLMAK
ncbi:MAG TPA: family 43 glycosylhydrolase [Verrucomicrobiae bacterium]|nr:family 43 glycosylhydrolase [Verrucomicrobiae bacterium]